MVSDGDESMEEPVTLKMPDFEHQGHEEMESMDSSESYTGESSSESTTSGFHGEDQGQKPGKKLKVKNDNNHMIASQSLAPNTSQSVTTTKQLFNVVTRDPLEAFLCGLDDGSELTELSDLEEQTDKPIPKTSPGVEKKVVEVIIEQH